MHHCDGIYSLYISCFVIEIESFNLLVKDMQYFLPPSLSVVDKCRLQLVSFKTRKNRNGSYNMKVWQVLIGLVFVLFLIIYFATFTQTVKSNDI